MKYSSTVRAMILRRTPLGEADWLLTLMTESHGKLRVVAKGARRTISHHVGHTELFSVIRGQINFRSRLPVISQVVGEPVPMENLAPPVLQRLSLIAEIADHGLDEGTANKAIFDLLADSTVKLRDDNQPLYFVGLILRLIGLLGYAPELRRCIVCGAPLASGQRYGWASEHGGIASDGCVRESMTPVGENELKAMRFLQVQHLSKMDSLRSDKVDQQALVNLMADYAEYVLERPIRSASVSLT